MRPKLAAVIVLGIVAAASSCAPATQRPNIILLMADDLGWGDVGFNGAPTVQTPSLDRLAAAGLTFDRFYSAAPVCSPTRASVLTGRHPFRQGIPGANSGHLRTEEITLAEMLQANGYATGFFGKWHLGTLTTEIQDSNRGRPGDATHYSLPTMNGFDTYLATESKVPTYDPMVQPDEFDASTGESLRYGWAALAGERRPEAYGTHYWEGEETLADTNLDGDDTRIVMDRVLPFLENAIESRQPFFTVVWLHTPHLPVVTDQAHRSLYPDLSPAEQLYYGAITAMDEQVGRLWALLEARGASDNTMLWFASDNGPERGTPGSAGPLRARKRSLYEGGVRVPAFLVWPDHVDAGRRTAVPAVTSDYLSTVLDVLDLEYPDSRPIDGVSLVGVLDGTQQQRGHAIGFRHGQQSSWVTDQYKLISTDQGQTYELYDLLADESEQHDLASEQPAQVETMKTALLAWIDSLARSEDGSDYRRTPRP